MPPCGGHSPPTACKHAVSGTISLPSQGFFSPFPHGTSSLSVAREYLVLPDGPGGFKQGFSCPALLRSHWKEDCIFTYAAVTLYGRPFQTVRLTLSYPPFNQANLPFVTEGPLDYCGPATPSSPFESPGLDFSAFARHYLRNHCCFLFLRVLRWFTSPSSLVHPMNSDIRSECSHSLGFPIRKSPDHSLVAASRGLSQLLASFIAFLRQGIHTHALSSLTIKSTSHTTRRYFHLRLHTCVSATGFLQYPTFVETRGTGCLCLYARQIFNCQRSICPEEFRRQRTFAYPLTSGFFVMMVGLGGLEPPTSSLSGMRSSQLSYRPSERHGTPLTSGPPLVELVGIEPATS